MNCATRRRRQWVMRAVTVALIVGLAAPMVSLMVAPRVDAVGLTLASGVSENSQTTTSTTFVASDTTIASAALPAGTYLVTWGAAIAGNGANDIASVRLVRGSTEIGMGGSEAAAATTANNGRSVSGYWLGSLSGSEALTIEYKVSSGSSYIDSKFIKAIRLDTSLLADSDYFTSGSQESGSDESANVATGSWTTIKTLSKTFHASVSQDYIILGSMEVSPDHISNDCMGQLVVDGTAVAVQTQEGEDTNDVYNYVVADVRAIGAGSKTITLQGQSVGGATCDYGRSRLYVFRANIFDQVLENEALTESTLASSTWTDKTSRSYTPNQAEDVLVIANQLVGSSVVSSPIASRISNTTDSAVYADAMSHVVNNATPDYYTNMSTASLTMSTAKTFKSQYQRVAGSGTVKIKEARLIVWSMTLKPSRVSQGVYRWFENANALGTEGMWWNSAWLARRKITFDNSASIEDLTNFPVRVSLNSSTIDYAKTQNSGQDIRFTDADGSVLKHEIETWDESGISEVWVKVPQIDAGSTTDAIYMYYHNVGASDGQDAVNVWDSNFKTVLHLEESPSNGAAGHDDSTGGSHDGTPQGFAGSAGSTTNASGKISGADHFSPDNDYVAIADHADYTVSSSGTYTWSAWVQSDAFEQYGTVWSQHLNSSDHMNLYVQSVTDSSYPGGGITSGVAVRFAIGSTSIVTETNDNAITAGVLQLITVTYDGTQEMAANRIKIYVNGLDVTGQTAAVGVPTGSINPSDTRIGGNLTHGGHFDGVIDESRFQATLRSAEWIEAEYRSTSYAMNTVGGEETSGTASGLTALVLANTAATVGLEVPLRLRQFFEQTQSRTAAGVTFKLQYAEKSGSCDVGFSGESYADVPTSGGALMYYNNPGIANGSPTAVMGGDAAPTGTASPQIYVESNTFSNSVSSLENGTSGVWDFAITSGASAAGKTYCVRTVYADGSQLYSYAYVAEVSIGGGGGPPPVPTTEQQLRHGQGVIDGTVAPLAL